MFKNYICAVDIGSDKISASLAQIKEKRIVNIFSETLSSKGVKKGIIIDSVELIERIDSLLKSLKLKSGINIKAVYVNISGQDIITKHSRAALPLAERGNKIITLSDVHKVTEQARILGSCLEEEIIHQMPYSYSIDSKSDILQPLGLYSHRLEIDLYLICVKTSSVSSLIRTINQSGYEVKKIFFSGIATSSAVFSKKMINEGVNVLCDIGSDITELLIFQDGLLKEISILQLGGNDLSLEVSESLKIPFELAEDVKKSNSCIADYNLIKEDTEILIKRNNIYKPIKQRFISEVLTSKAKSVCQIIRDNVERIVPCNHVNNFIATGRTVLQEGFLETLENTLGIPVQLGRIDNPEVSSLLNKENDLKGQRYLAHITSLGMICQALEGEQSSPLSLTKPTRNIFVKILNKAKEVYQEYF